MAYYLRGHAAQRLGRFDEAMTFFERSRAHLTDETDEATKANINYRYFIGLGEWNADMARYDAAADAFVEAQVWAEKTNRAVGVAFSKLRLCSTKLEQGDLVEAERILRDLEESDVELAGSVVMSIKRARAALTNRQGRWQEAADAYREILALMEESNGTDTPSLLLALTPAAANLRAGGRLQEALEFAQRAHDLGQKHLPPGNWMAAEASSELAYTLDALGRSAEARELAQKAHRDLEATFNASHPKVQSIARVLEG